MKKQLMTEVTRQMAPFLDNAQLEKLQEVLKYCLWNVTVTETPNCEQQPEQETNEELLNMFLSAKRVEGCSEKHCIIMKMLYGGCLLRWIAM